MAKIGDTVRFLNSVGGGKVVKIEGNIAYVDEDGFETPVLLRECVVVTPAAGSEPAPSKYVPPTVVPEQPKAPKPETFEETETAISLDHPYGSCQISIRYTTEGVAVAEWSLSPMTFSLSSDQNTDREAFSQLVTQIASNQLDANHTLTQGNLQEQFAEMACDSSIIITVSGKTYTPYATVVYSTFWDGENMISADSVVQIEGLKNADVLPAVPYSSDFTVNFTSDGKLDVLILHDENFQRLEDAWSFDVFSQLTPGTYYVQAVVAEYGDYIPKANRAECSGIDCVFELIVE